MLFIPLLVLVTAIGNPCYGQYNSKDTSLPLPSPVKYFDLPEEHSFETSARNGDPKKKEPKFGFQIGYGNDLQGYSGNGIVGTYTPLKIDLGGLVLGTIIGLGAIVLAPKLLHLFAAPPHHGGVPPYGRSADMLSEIGNTISRIDENLQGMDIDSLACLQRATCTLIRYVDPTTTQKYFNSSSNTILNFFFGGSKLKNAMDVAMKGEDCSTTYSKCTFKNNMFDN